MNLDFLEPGRLWLLLVVAALGVLSFATVRWRRGATLRFTQIELLDQVAPRRPQWRRYVVAGLQLLGLAVAVGAVARPVDRGTETLTSEGRILMLFDVSLSMDADDVDPNRLAAAQEAAREFIGAVDDGVEVGLVSFSGTVAVEVNPTLDRDALTRAVDDRACRSRRNEHHRSWCPRTRCHSWWCRPSSRTHTRQHRTRCRRRRRCHSCRSGRDRWPCRRSHRRRCSRRRRRHCHIRHRCTPSRRRRKGRTSRSDPNQPSGRHNCRRTTRGRLRMLEPRCHCRHRSRLH